MAQAKRSLGSQAIRKIVNVEDKEIRAMLWSCLFFFCILAAYYILRPIRDEAAVAGGVRNLPWLFSGTLLVMLAINPLFCALVASLPRLKFVSMSYRFFIFNLFLFFLALTTASPGQNVWIGRVFYIWTSVFNLFVVSLFWAFMADLFTSAQGKRIFGFIAFGGTFGGIIGSSLTAGLVGTLGSTNLMLFSMLLLESAVFCMKRLSAESSEPTWKGSLPASHPESPSRLPPDSNIDDDFGTTSVENRIQKSPSLREGRSDSEIIGGSVLAGISHVVRSPYLLGISSYMLLFTISATFLYFQQAEIIDANFIDRATRTAVFARIDLAVNVVAVLTQVFLTGRVIKLLGVGLTLGVLPAICLFGFTSLGFWPSLTVLVVFQVLRRSGNYALARPCREILYTVLWREDKYKAKNFVDTFIYRFGDQIGAWGYAFLMALGMGMAAISLAAVPLTGLWLSVAVWLGHRQQDLAENCPEPPDYPG